MINGGIGDFLYYVQAIRYVSMTVDHKRFAVISRDFFLELAKHFLKGYIDEIHGEKVRMTPGAGIWQPKPMMPGHMGFHPAEIAFMYYNNSPVPKGWEVLPRIEGDEVDIDVPEKYVVINAGGTTGNRTLPAHVVIGLSNYVKQKGYTPVFLGKREITQGYHTNFANVDYDSLGIDLRDKTGLLEAGCIMANAKLVIGIDGGLMHLACCSDVPALWASTVASWENRMPFRDAWTKNVQVDGLDCLHCQERYRYMPEHDFRNCLTGHLRCVQDLTTPQFISLAEEVL